MEIKILIEDYERRITTINKLIDKEQSLLAKNRLETKRDCYRTFLSELQKCTAKSQRCNNCKVDEVITDGCCNLCGAVQF